MSRAPWEAPRPEAVRRVVVVQLYFLGDTLLATPAIRALRARFPGASLEVVVKRRSAAALARNPHLSRLSLYDPPHLWQRPFHWAELGRRWAREAVDLAVDLTADRRSARLLSAMRPAAAIGFLNPGRGPAVDAGIPKACGPEHVARHMLRLVGLAGAAGSAELEFHPSDAARAAARAWQAGRGGSAAGDAGAAAPAGPGGPLVALHPGCHRVLRRWRLERFGELARRLRAAGARVWVTGGAEDAPLGAQLEASGAENLAGRLSLDEAGARLEASDLLVANDSAPMHLAAAVGTPVLALFGPSLPHTVAPAGARHAHLHMPLPCCPCDQRRCVRPDDFCLDRISVAEVLRRAGELLAAGRGVLEGPCG